MEETATQLVPGNNIAKAAKQSTLSLIFDTQEKTAALVRVLGEKLQPVSNPVPVDGKESADRGYHLESALYRQQDINQALSYIIDTLVV